MIPDLVIRNGTVVDGSGSREETLFIKDGKYISPYEVNEKGNFEQINAKGKILLPGIIDCHTHYQMKCGRKRPDTPDIELTSCDSFLYGTRNALMAGTTTIIDFTHQEKGYTLTKTLESRLNEMNGACACDYSLHCGISEVDKETLNELHAIKSMGIPTFKLHTSYGKRGLKLDYGEIYLVMKKARELDCMVVVHAEEERLVQTMIREMLDSADFALKNIELVRPEFVEAGTISMLIMMAEHIDCKLHISHISSARGWKEVKIAKSQDIDVSADVSIPHLFFTSDIYKSDNSFLYSITPPLRGKNTVENLWEGIRTEDIEIITSNHCPFSRELKNMEKGNFSNLPSGLPGAEALFPSVYTEAVMNRKMTLPHIARLLSENPAKRMGLYGKKGAIKPGFDADLIIIDPANRNTYKISNFPKVDYDWSPYEGCELYGYPETVLLRGKKVVSSYSYTGDDSDGQLIKRGLPVQ
ncbi:MAG: amidohydrolase family protein [Oligoflexia bacterium]|nr:amidohydrolase family protein [Oligoflexia bacterium]